MNTVVRQFMRPFEFHGRTHQAAITIQWVWDHDYQLDELNAELRAEIETGNVDVAIVIVTAYWLQLEGNDYLGGVFLTEPGDVETVVEEYGMVGDAINNLIETMKNVRTQLL